MFVIIFMFVISLMAVIIFMVVIPSGARDLQFAAKCRSLALSMTNSI